MNLPSDKYEWVGTIETFTGRAVDVVNFTPEQVDLEDIVQSLSLICRYNGHIPSFYSVAEHSVRVAWYLKKQAAPLEVQLGGLLHDAAEAYVGDMIRPLKRHPEVGTLHQRLEKRVSDAIGIALGGDLHSALVSEADMALYYWEVENIRTGHRVGWTPEEARKNFMFRYNYIKSDMEKRWWAS